MRPSLSVSSEAIRASSTDRQPKRSNLGREKFFALCPDDIVGATPGTRNLLTHRHLADLQIGLWISWRRRSLPGDRRFIHDHFPPPRESFFEKGFVGYPAARQAPW